MAIKVQQRKPMTIAQILKRLDEIHGDVQAKFHDKWDWIDAAFSIEQLKAHFEFKDKRIAALEAWIKELDWTPITEDNMPKVGNDEVGRKRLGRPYGTWIVCDVSDIPFKQRVTARQYRSLGWTHFRPINAPAAKQAEDQS
jgi:hypothetical protein